MPLTESITFKTRLQGGNRVQVPKSIRCGFGLETSQILKVVVGALEAQSGWETSFARMDKSGRITIPKLTLGLMQSAASKQSLTGEVMEVSIEPA